MNHEREVKRTTRLLVTDICRVTKTDFAKHFQRAVRAAAFTKSLEVVAEAAPMDDLPRDWFIHDGDEFVCGDCNHRLKLHDVSLDTTEVWEWFSNGWLGPCVCRVCKLSIPVILDGDSEVEP